MTKPILTGYSGPTAIDLSGDMVAIPEGAYGPSTYVSDDPFSPWYGVTPEQYAQITGLNTGNATSYTTPLGGWTGTLTPNAATPTALDQYGQYEEANQSFREQNSWFDPLVLAGMGSLTGLAATGVIGGGAGGAGAGLTGVTVPSVATPIATTSPGIASLGLAPAGASTVAAGSGLGGALAGVGGAAAAGGARTAATAAGAAGASRNLQSFLPGIISGAASLLGGYAASENAQDAIDAQLQAQREALDFQRESRDIALDILRPETQTSQLALARMLQMTGQAIPGALQDALNESGVQLGEYDFTTDPGYEFRMDEGMRALENSAFARGGGMSGGFARSALRYAQDYASNEYSKIYDRLASLSGRSQTTNEASTVLNFGTGAARTALEGGDARASGYIAQGNAWQNTLDQISQIPWDEWLPARTS